MSSEHDASPAPRSGMKWLAIGIVVVALFGAAGLLGMWWGGRQTAEPVVTPMPVYVDVFDSGFGHDSGYGHGI